MKISVRVVSEVHEGEVRCRSVRHDHRIRIDVGIDVEVRSKSWVAGVSGFWLCFLGLSCCVF